MFLRLLQESAALVGEAANENHDEVDESTKTEASCGEKPNDTGAYFTYVETVNTKTAKEEAQKCSYDLIL